MLSRLQLQ